MKKICVLSVMLCTSTIALAAKPVMPKQFLGNWAESKDSCVIPKDSPIDFPGDGAKIRKDGIERYEYWCELKSISKSTKQSLTARFVCSNEDGEQSEIYKLSLSAEGKLLGIKDEGFFRCK